MDNLKRGNYMKAFLLILFLVLISDSFAWDKKRSIGGPTVDSSAVLDVQSTTKGSIHSPKMTTTQRNAITSPAEGLGVWDLTVNKRSDYDGSNWLYSVYESLIQTLTNKTIDADLNTITNIENADIKALAAIDATKVHDGSVDNTEFGYLNGVTSALQAQLDGKIGSGSGQIYDVDVNAAANINATKLGTGVVDNTEFNKLDGVVGAIVGDTATQTLTNKTITGADFRTPLRSDVKQDTEANLITYATTATEGQLVWATDTDKLYYIVSNSLVEVGTGAGGGDINNLLTDGGFDQDATSGVDGLTCTVGTCSQELTIKYIGDGALKIALTAQAANVVKCYDNTNTQWDGQMVQLEARVKSSDPTIEFCYWDGTSEGNCTHYDGSDEWRKLIVRESVSTENSICWKIKSSTATDDVYVDASKIWEFEPQGTTKVIEQTLFLEDVESYASTNTHRYYFKTTSIEPLKTSGSGLFTYTRDTVNGDAVEIIADGVVCSGKFQGEVGSASGMGIGINAGDQSPSSFTSGNRLDSWVNDGTGQGESGSYSNVPVKKGDIISIHADSGSLAPTGNARWVWQTSCKKYEQAKVLSEIAQAKDYENHYGFRINNNGTASIASQNGTPLATVNRASLGTINATWTANYFGVAPTITCVPDRTTTGGMREAPVSNVTTSGFTVITIDSTNTLVDSDVHCKVTRQNEDYIDSATVVATFRPAVKTIDVAQTTNQSIPDNTYTVVNFDTTNQDVDGNFSLASDRYTVPVNGDYEFIFRPSFAANVSGIRAIGFRKNGSTLVNESFYIPSASYESRWNAKTIITGLQAGDYIEVMAYQNSGGALNLSGSTLSRLNVTKVDQAGVINTGIFNAFTSDETATVTGGFTNATGKWRLEKTGKTTTVYWEMNAGNSGGAPTDTVQITGAIPLQYRPSVDISGPMTLISTGSNTASFSSIGSNGNIQCLKRDWSGGGFAASNWAASENCNGSASWIDQ